jgi:hypothetical protein
LIDLGNGKQVRKGKGKTMKAVDVINNIKQLPPEERQKVIDYVFKMVTEGDISDDFKRMTNETFTLSKPESWA